MLVHPERLTTDWTVILGERRVRERIPLVREPGRNDDPLAEVLAPTGRVEEVGAGKGERASMSLRVGELEDHRALCEAGDHASGALETRHSEHLRSAQLRVPRRECVDDLVVPSPCVVHGSGVEDVVALEERVVGLDALLEERDELLPGHA